MTDTHADRMRRFLAAVCDALDSADPRVPTRLPTAAEPLPAPPARGEGALSPAPGWRLLPDRCSRSLICRNQQSVCCSRACWPEYRPVAVRALAVPVLVGVAVSAAGCQRPVGVKYAGPPPPPPDEVQEIDSVSPAEPAPPSTQPRPATFPGASESPGDESEPPVPEPEPPDMVVKYGAPPPIDAVPKYGIPIEAVPVEPPPSEPLPGHKYGGPPPGPVQTRYGIPY
jgi:hypothetical protein